MNYRVILLPQAEYDLEASAVWWSEEHSVEQGCLRYEALLVQAIMDLMADPRRRGTQRRPELWPAAFSYHLSFSRKHVATTIGRVRRPRHFLLGRFADTGDSGNCPRSA